jgi:hypothetical protein
LFVLIRLPLVYPDVNDNIKETVYQLSNVIARELAEATATQLNGLPESLNWSMPLNRTTAQPVRAHIGKKRKGLSFIPAPSGLMIQTSSLII